METLKIADGFSLPIAPKKRNSGAVAAPVAGNWMYTAAAVSGGRTVPGSWKTTMWEKCGLNGNEKANFVGWVFGSEGTGTASVRQGLPGRITENIVICLRVFLLDMSPYMYRVFVSFVMLLCFAESFQFSRDDRVDSRESLSNQGYSTLCRHYNLKGDPKTREF